MFVFNFVIYMIYWKTKLYFASKILLNFTLKWDDIKTVITGLLKANINNHMLNYKRVFPYVKFIHGYRIEQLITDKVFILERICLQFYNGHLN